MLIKNITLWKKVMSDQHDYILTSINESIQKLTSISTDLSKMLAVQENRIDNQEKFTENLMSSIKYDIEVVHGRIDKVKNDLKESHSEVINQIEETRKENKEQHNMMSARLSRLEKWILLVSGGGIVIGYLISLAIRLV